MSKSANLWRALGAIVLIALVLFLAVDTGSRLLEPNQFALRRPACTLSTLAGSVKVQAVDSMAWKAAEDGMRLEPGSRVKTLPDSYALLTFFDGTTTKLEPETDVAVVRLEGETSGQPSTVLLKQWSGKTWNQVTHFDPDSAHFRIETPSALATVRGTVFLSEVEKSGKTIIKTNRGQVDVVAQGQEVQVSAGNQTRVGRGMAPSAPAPTTPSRNELTLKVGGPALVKIVDPNGASSGYLPNGAPVTQIAGADSVMLGTDSRIIRIPEPRAGAYIAEFYGTDGGLADFDIQFTADGVTHFKRAGSVKATTGSEEIVRFNIDVPAVQNATPTNAEKESSVFDRALAYFLTRDYDAVVGYSIIAVMLLVFLYAWIRR